MISLLGVYTKLKAIVAAIDSEETQNELIEQARGLILDINNDHTFAAEAHIQDPSLKQKLINHINTECQELVDYVIATKRFNLEVNARSKDRVISFGEKLSCWTMTTLLQDVVGPLLLTFYSPRSLTCFIHLLHAPLSFMLFHS